MSRPCGSGTAAAFENARGNEPILATFSRVFPCNRLLLALRVAVVGGDVFVVLPPQPAAKRATAIAVASANLGT